MSCSTPHAPELFPLTTALEQRWLGGAVTLGLTRDGRRTTRTQTVSPNASVTLPVADGSAGSNGGDSVLWVAHGGTVFVFAPLVDPASLTAEGNLSTHVTVSTEHKHGNWSSIGVANGTEAGPVFVLHLTHAEGMPTGGVAPAPAATGLAYTMFTDVSAPAAPAVVSHMPHVLSRTDAVHAVLLQNHTLSVAFFDAAAVTVAAWGIRLVAHQPCSVIVALTPTLIRPHAGWATLSIADPTQALPSATVACVVRAGISDDCLSSAAALAGEHCFPDGWHVIVTQRSVLSYMFHSSMPT